ncbi:hypothetical protein [Micromonospora sp. NPDC047074]
MGTAALLSGLLVSALTISADSAEPHLLAGLLVLAGVGLRVEAAILASRA